MATPPQFEPNTVSFDQDNHPYIRLGGVVQTQGRNGDWVSLSISDSITRYYQGLRRHLTFDIKGGSFVDQRVVFDDRGDAYTIVQIISGKNPWWFLLHSQDRCVSWDVYPLPSLSHARLEFRDGHNKLTAPPALLLVKDEYLGLVLPVRKADGTLEVPRAITVSEDSLLVSNHSGGANSVITVGDLVFVVYPLAKKWLGYDGTSQFVTAYDRNSGTVVTPQTLLGSVGQGVPDPHNLPGITVDGSGYLHVLLGGHHNNLYYLKSLSPRDVSAWETPVAIGKQVVSGDGGHTYPALLCDSNNQLHVVTRWAGEKDYKFRLVYNTRDALTGQWLSQKVLVSPFRSFYSIWYHHLSMDRNGRLFLNYRYYGNQLTAEQIDAYRIKWPEDGVPANAQPYPRQDTIQHIQSHDPAMLFSDNGGGLWKLTTSADLFTTNN